ncbi:MAG TPA: methyltransferase domain-containing protein [Acidisphaera sp.]|nr:methyltransferase domain-containing protein [Acidisphaera sp.]
MARALATGRFARRSTAAELMDTDCRDYDDYRRCIRDLSRVNVVTRTHAPALRWLDAALGEASSFSLLDVACGYGDLLRTVARWAERRGTDATLTGIDLNPWSARAAAEAEPASMIRYVTGDVFGYQPDPPPDFIVSSQFAHHLDDATLPLFLRWMEERAVRGWLVLDLRRHWFPYYGFPLLARAMGWHRFIRYDGQVSIVSSLIVDEWRAAIDEAGLSNLATARERFPFRIEVSRIR